MDGSNQRQRSRPPYPRAPSRSSTHTTNSRMTPISANSSTSQIAASPQPSNSHVAHRYHHSSCATSTSSPRPTSRLGPQLSRQGSSESARLPAVSSFLQERLQKERKVEIDKLSHSPSLSRAATDMSGSLDFGRAVPASPFRGDNSESSRPRSSAGAEQSKKKTMGVKEMEQVISTLHKQNFDLKLELFHRREKQSNMEERLDSLEADKAQMTETNDRLLAELEKRDKAVEEAVAMIVTLEARVDQLFKERQMVQQVTDEGYFCPSDLEKSYVSPVRQIPGPDSVELESDAKVINRMPSFLSEKSENTQNLRNVYLGARGSIFNLNPVTEASPNPDNGGTGNGLASPTLSVLSESSFVSVYGQRKGHEFLAAVDEPLKLDGLDNGSYNPTPQHSNSASTEQVQGPNRASRSNSASRPYTANSQHFQSITNIMDHAPPLQRIVRLDHQLANTDRARPASSGRDMDVRPASAMNRLPTQKPNKQEKREALRKVVTDGPGGVRLHDQGYPPTPDTISSSTLQRLKNSNDTLSPQLEAPRDRNQGVALSSQSSGERLPEPPCGVSLQAATSPEKSWNRSRGVSGSSLYSQKPRLIQRPRSASESTVSHRQENGWDSDGDDSDTHSLESSLDIWMRESAQPSRKAGRESPDLFSFPTSASRGGWATDSMFGPNSAQRGGAGLDVNSDFIHDLFSLRQGHPGGMAPPPPPPHRRSSLYAQTGPGVVDIGTLTGNPSIQESWQASPDTRARHSQTNSEDLRSRDDMTTPVQQQGLPPPNSDQKRYPPITGHQGPRSGFNRLFRRSLSGTPSNSKGPDTAPPSPAMTVVASFTDAPENPSEGVGSAAWASKSCAIDDDRSGATPPPIMFNPRQGRRNTSVEIPAATAAAIEQGRAASASLGGGPRGMLAGPMQDMTGARRKWLPGFGRASNLRNKN